MKCAHFKDVHSTLKYCDEKIHDFFIMYNVYRCRLLNPNNYI